MPPKLWTGSEPEPAPRKRSSRSKRAVMPPGDNTEKTHPGTGEEMIGIPVAAGEEATLHGDPDGVELPPIEQS